LKGELAGIGVERGDFQAEGQGGHQLTSRKIELPDHDAAWKTLFDWLQGHEKGKDLHAVGHRFVQGGMAHVKPQIVSPALIGDFSKKGTPVTVRVMKTNEELMIARHTRDLIIGS
jgi:acetate kinase